MPTTTIYPSSHTFVSNKNQSADYTNIPHPRTDRWFYNATTDDTKWTNASKSSFAIYVEGALLRFQRPNALKYSRITSATLHLTVEGMHKDSSGSTWESTLYNWVYIATYTTQSSLSAISWSNFKQNGTLGEWANVGGLPPQKVSSPYSRDISVTSLYNGDLSGSEFTLCISAGDYTLNPSEYGSNFLDPSSCYLTVTYEAGTQPVPTPIYPKDVTLIQSPSTLFSWQFNSETEAVQTAAELQYKNVEDENYTTVSLSQSGYSYTLNEELPAGSYQWRVKVTNDAGTSSGYSSVAYFNVVGKPASPIINEPENKTLTTITWNTTNQQSCEIILKDQAGKELYHETLAMNETVYKPNFFLNGAYLFSVRVMNDSMMWSDWAQRAFTISASGPDAATISLVSAPNDPAVNLSFEIPEGTNAVLMRSLGTSEKVIAKLNEFDTAYRDDTVAANVNYKYWIRTYVDGYTDTTKIDASVSFEGSILNGAEASLNLNTSNEKFLPHSEDISREYALLSLSGREYQLIERSEFTKVEFTRRFHVSAVQRKVLDALSKEDTLFYRDTKENAYSVGLKRVHYDEFMDDGYIATLEFARLNDEEVMLNV